MNENTTIPAIISPKKKLTAAQEAKEANIELVRKLQIRGVTKVREIKAYFKRQEPPIHLKNRTIERYKAIVKQRNAKRLVKSEELWKTVEELAMELRDSYREITKELWMIVHKRDTSPRDKISAMSQINDISNKWIDRLQSLGLVHEEPTKVQMVDANGNPTDPPPTQVKIDIENMNMDFVAFIKAKYQDPIGVTRDFKNLSRTPDATTTITQ